MFIFARWCGKTVCEVWFMTLNEFAPDAFGLITLDWVAATLTGLFMDGAIGGSRFVPDMSLSSGIVSFGAIVLVTADWRCFRFALGWETGLVFMLEWLILMLCTCLRVSASPWDSLNM